MVTDPVGDALIRIKNGYLARKTQTNLGYSKLVMAICQVLLKEGYIESFKQEKDGAREVILVDLKYDGRRPAMSEVKRISKPGFRVYSGKKTLPWVLNGLGIALISTPRGLMTDKQARKEGLGGEVMAHIW